MPIPGLDLDQVNEAAGLSSGSTTPTGFITEEIQINEDDRGQLNKIASTEPTGVTLQSPPPSSPEYLAPYTAEKPAEEPPFDWFAQLAEYNKSRDLPPPALDSQSPEDFERQLTVQVEYDRFMQANPQKAQFETLATTTEFKMHEAILADVVAERIEKTGLDSYNTPENHAKELAIYIQDGALTDKGRQLLAQKQQQYAQDAQFIEDKAKEYADKIHTQAVDYRKAVDKVAPDLSIQGMKVPEEIALYAKNIVNTPGAFAKLLTAESDNPDAIAQLQLLAVVLLDPYARAQVFKQHFEGGFNLGKNQRTGQRLSNN